MVQLERVSGQRGHMVINEEGSIISSSGELSSSENTAQQLLNLVSHALPVNFNSSTSSAAVDESGQNQVNGVLTVNGGGDNLTGQVWKWNRLSVDFGDHSFVACLSNKKIHVVKRDHSHPSAEVDHSSAQQT